jgi:hypothetical protein
MRSIQTGLLALALVVVPAPGGAEDDELARELEREMREERAQDEKIGEAILRTREEAAAAAPVLVLPPAESTLQALDPVTEADRAREAAIQVQQAAARAKSEAWRDAWEALARDETFRRFGCVPSRERLDEIAADYVQHRPLTLADFRAKEESREVRSAVEVADTVVAAHVATTVVCVGQLRGEEIGGRAVVSLESLEYVALLRPEGSWWNPKTVANPEWMLRHEQLHFDIAEVFARRRSRESAADVAATRTVADTPGEAVALFAKRWSTLFGSVIAGLLDVQDSYDRETRHGTVPKVQTEWFAKVRRDLAETR